MTIRHLWGKFFMKMLMWGAALALALSGPAFAASETTSPAPGKIMLTTQMVMPNGKPYLDETEREPGLKVITAFTVDGVNFKPGDQITDSDKIASVMAGLKAQKAPAGGDMTFAVQSVDPNCEHCAPLTEGWVIAQALTTRVCPPKGSQAQQKSPFCTDDEQKQEDDDLIEAARASKALEIIGGADKKNRLESMTLGDKSKVLVENLIKARFAQAPDLVVQALGAISGGTIKTPEWGND